MIDDTCITTSGDCYNPEPPRLWNRLENNCSYDSQNIQNIQNNTTVTLPLVDISVPYSEYDIWMSYLNKGNVLQYKKNAANFTKNQIFTRIVNNLWVNRNTSWATQNMTTGYTNPNSLSLKRVGNYENIAIRKSDNSILGKTILPVTCKPNKDSTTNYVLPDSNPIIPSPNTPPVVLPPSEPSNDTNITIPKRPDVSLDDFFVIPDGGKLLCNTFEDICTGKIVDMTVSDLDAQLTTSSDVPAKIDVLYWNDRIATWYPRQTYTMSTSGNKFPTNSKDLRSAVNPLPATITNISFDNIKGNIDLYWTQSNNCIIVNEYDLYQNDILYISFSGTLRNISISISIDPNQTNLYTYFLIGRNGKTNSKMSNVVSITV